jgi:transcriptional regulator with XRE-family HTH domain
MENQWKILVLLLQQIAEQKGLTQQEIAKKSEMHQSHISRFFALKYSPDIKTFLKISKAIEVNFFFEDKESRTDLNLAMEKAMEELGRRVDKLSKN